MLSGARHRLQLVNVLDLLLRYMSLTLIIFITLYASNHCYGVLFICRYTINNT